MIVDKRNNKSENGFLVFSDDWGRHPSSCQHLFRYLPDSCSALWVNTVGMRTPKLTARDFKKAVVKTKNMINDLMKNKADALLDTGRITVSQPPMIPLQNIPGIKRLNVHSVSRTVRKRLQYLAMDSPVLVVTAPNASDYLGLFGERRIIYYCVDNFSEWPGINKKLVQKMEESLIRKADVLIATSQALVDRLSHKGREVHLLTHGVEYELFGNAPEEEHYLLERIRTPRVGYFGLFDDRNDQGLIHDLARRMPDISFVMTGSIEADIASLRKQENIYFTGGIPYHELPAMAKGWDICILPYKINQLTNSIQPLKIKEYLATGKPVISTPIKEAQRLKRYVSIAETSESWEKEIRHFLTDTPSNMQEERKLFLKKESWSQKAELFFNICLKDR